MLAEFKHAMRRLRGQIIGWGIGLGLYGAMIASLYPSVTGMGDLAQLIESYPAEMKAFFKGMTALNTPGGYLDTYFFSMMPLIVGIMAVIVGAGLLAGDEEKGILELTMAHPVSRTQVFLGRALGFAAATAAVLAISWLSWLPLSQSSGLGLGWLEFLRPYLPLFAELMLFGMLALLASLLLPASAMGAMLAGALLAGSFLVLGLAGLNTGLEPFIRYTPLYYYQGGNAVSGLNWGWFTGLIAIALALAVGAWALFRQRDIRVSGEHGWQLPGHRRRRPARAGSR